MPRQDHDDMNGNPATKREHPSDAPRRATEEPTEAARWAAIDGIRKAAKSRSAVGEALRVHGEAVDHVEALYLQHAGEVTDETEAAEARRDVTAREAAEHVARYLRWLDDQRQAVKRERLRLDALDQRLDKRQRWAEGHAVELLERVAPGRSKATVGTFTLAVRRTTAVETGEGFDVAQLPAAWTREIAEVPAVPARPALDKAAAKADMLLGYREGPPPGAGWYDVEGHGRMWLFPGTAPGSWRVSDSGPGRDRIVFGHVLAFLGLSIEPEPGMDTLRWKPSPPGVSLVRRVHVKVE